MNRYVRVLVSVSSFVMIALAANMQEATARQQGTCKACALDCSLGSRDWYCDIFCGAPGVGAQCWEDEWGFCEGHPGWEWVIPCADD